MTGPDFGGQARPHAAIVYDQQVMSFKGIDRVSLLTLEGRVVVPFILGNYSTSGSSSPGAKPT